MNSRPFLVAGVVLLSLARPSWAASVFQVPEEPFFQLETEGPTALVTALAFSPDGKTLYAAGGDKVVRVWTLDAKGRFERDSKATIRVPIGPGARGAINALAVAPDGNWLAVGGNGVIRGETGFRQEGVWLPASGFRTDEMWRDQGLIYVYDTRQPRQARPLRGHMGRVLALAFAPPRPGKPLILASAANEWDPDKQMHVGVVRLWDVDRQRQVREFRGLPQPTNRPSLALFYSGAELERLTLAVAWNDGKLRVGHLDEEGLQEVADGRYNITAAAGPSPNAFLTGSFRRAGTLQAWRMQEGKPVPEDGGSVTFPPENETHFAPRALALFASQNRGALDHAAVVVRSSDAAAYRLFLVNLKSLQRVADFPLWAGEDLPTLATAAGGRHLAVAGDQGRSIQVHALTDLLAQRSTPQVLRSSGVRVSNVSFVEREKELGLRFGPAEGKGIVVDFARRRVQGELDGWEAANAAAETWRAQAVDRGVRNKSAWVVQAADGDKVRTEVALPEAREITATAVLPPRKPLAVPIVAIAYRDREGQPLLGLYNGTTGEQIRQLAGHADTIRSLAFVKDGSLLASSSDDQTVNLWSLKNLDQLLGERGLIRGVTFADRATSLTVGSLDSARIYEANRTQLKAGDQIEGLVVNKRVLKLPSAWDLYEAIWRMKPGARATLRLADKRDVALVVGQGIDEQMPLLSLFLKSNLAGKWEWVGWSPTGLYDVSSDAAERFLGWHFNNARPEKPQPLEEPTTFAEARQHRKDYFRPGILSLLVAQGNAGDALERWKQLEADKALPDPKMSFRLDDDVLEERVVLGQDRLLVRQPPAKLGLSIVNPEFPPDRVEQIAWKVGDATGKFSPEAGREWSADLARQLGVRGEHAVQVELRIRAIRPKVYTRRFTVLYLPPAPEIKPVGLLPREVKQPSFDLAAMIHSGQSAAGVQVRLLLNDIEQPLTFAPEAGKPVPVKQRLTLREGTNRIQLHAVNKGALKEHEAEETGKLDLSITFNPPKRVPQPRIVLSRIEPLPGQAATDAEWPIETGKPVVVNVPRVRLWGWIEGAESLTLASWAQDAASPPMRKLDRFEPNVSADWVIRQEVELQPGPQKLRFRSQSEHSVAADEILTIHYRPSLPQVEQVLAPSDGIALLEGKDKPTVALKARLTKPFPSFPFEAAIRLNDQKLDLKPTIDPKLGLLTALVPLDVTERDHRLQVELSNGWAPVELSRSVSVQFLRLPRILKTAGPVQTEDPSAIVMADVYSSLKLANESVQASVNGRSVGRAEVTPAAEPAHWKVRLANVPLDRDRNEVRLRISNEHGASDEAVRVIVRVRPAPPAKPEVWFTNPSSSTTVREATLAVEFQVRSAAPLQRVELLRNGKAVKLPKNNAGAVTATVNLEPGLNTLRIAAVNAGGESLAEATVSYVDRPVWVEIDRIEPRDGGEAIEPVRQVNNQIAFTHPAAVGKVWLHGRIVWWDASERKDTNTAMIRVRVNELLQLSTGREVQSGAGRELRFRAPILLTRKHANVVKVELPEFKTAASSRLEFSIDCTEPVRGQHLHLLMVSLGDRDPKALSERVLEALQAEPQGERRFHKPGFAEGQIYGPVTGYVTRSKVLRQLNEIKRDVRRLAPQGDSTSLVLIYYRGIETVAGNDHFYQTSESQQSQEPTQSAVSGREMALFFADTPGAQVFLMDVVRDQAPRAQWPAEEDPFGVLRYAWLDPKNPQPDNARLLAGLVDVMPQAQTWKDLASRLGDRWQNMQQKWASHMTSDPHVPPLLAIQSVSRSID